MSLHSSACSLRIHFQLAKAKSTVTNRVCNAHKECNVNWGDSVSCIAKRGCDELICKPHQLVYSGRQHAEQFVHAVWQLEFNNVGVTALY